MTKVYEIYWGSYDDTSVLAIFSSREKAEAAQKDFLERAGWESTELTEKGTYVLLPGRYQWLGIQEHDLDGELMYNFPSEEEKAWRKEYGL